MIGVHDSWYAEEGLAGVRCICYSVVECINVTPQTGMLYGTHDHTYIKVHVR